MERHSADLLRQHNFKQSLADAIKVFSPDEAKPACKCSSLCFFFRLRRCLIFSVRCVIYGAVSIRMDRGSQRDGVCASVSFYRGKKHESEKRATNAQFKVISGNFVSNIISFCRFFPNFKVITYTRRVV